MPFEASPRMPLVLWKADKVSFVAFNRLQLVWAEYLVVVYPFGSYHIYIFFLLPVGVFYNQLKLRLHEAAPLSSGKNVCQTHRMELRKGANHGNCRVNRDKCPPPPGSGPQHAKCRHPATLRGTGIFLFVFKMGFTWGFVTLRTSHLARF